jgi:hypothetical protein
MRTARDAFEISFETAAGVSAAIALVTAITAALLLRHVPTAPGLER